MSSNRCYCDSNKCARCVNQRVVEYLFGPSDEYADERHERNIQLYRKTRKQRIAKRGGTRTLRLVNSEEI